MEALDLARLQFAVTTVYHFFFVPLTLGLSLIVAVMETMYVRTGNPDYKRMTKFWGKLFLINFAIGVVTGIVQEFQFGMNWSDFSRFVGDIFGAPLAIEALLAFFMESTFLGIWVFGWDRLNPKLHAGAFWLVAIGSNISAFWILLANSFMQHPVGYVFRNGRAELQDFFALLANPYLHHQFSHVFFGGLTTGAFFVLGISAWHLLRRNPDRPLFEKSFSVALVFAIIATISVVGTGHVQAQWLAESQPMKFAAMEAHYETSDPAALSIFTIADEKENRAVFSIAAPAMLSFMLNHNFTGEVKGINDIQSEYEQKYGAGDYSPPVNFTHAMFRIMAGAGTLMIVLALTAGAILFIRKKPLQKWLLKLMVFAISLPYIANSTGWLLTEVGRQPWLVFGIMKTEHGVSPTVTSGEVLFSLIAFTLVYGSLMAVTVFLLKKFAAKGMPELDGTQA